MLLTERLQNSIGALCEVRTPNNDLIFVGKLHTADENFIAVISSSSDTLPPAIFNAEVKVSVRSAAGLIVLGGSVSRSGADFWGITKLRHYQSSENRNFFRQRISARATVIRVPLHDLPEAEACRVDPEGEKGSREAPEEENPVAAKMVDISLGGILFASETRFAVGETVELSNVQLLPNEMPFTFRCKICRADASKPNSILCGCSFEKMGGREQDRLCRVIFVLQRNELKKRRQMF